MDEVKKNIMGTYVIALTKNTNDLQRALSHNRYLCANFLLRCALGNSKLNCMRQ